MKNDKSSLTLVFEILISLLCLVAQRFAFRVSSNRFMFLAEIVGNIVFCGGKHKVKSVIKLIEAYSKFETITVGPYLLPYFEMSIIYDSNRTFRIDSDGKLNNIECQPPIRTRQRKLCDFLNYLQIGMFLSVNSAILCLSKPFPYFSRYFYCSSKELVL